MKAVLLGSTALVGIGLLIGPAAAQLEVTIGGEVRFLAGHVDSEFGGFEQDFTDFETASEVIIRADGIADNGLEYGAKIEIQATAVGSEGNSDEVSLYVGGSWGRLEFGDFDGAADEMTVYAPTVGNGQLDGDYVDFVGIDLDFKPFDSEDSTKVNYYTPRFAGFRLGVAYAPYFDQGESVVADHPFEDFVEAGLDYVAEFGSFGVLAGVTYTRYENNFISETEDGWAAGLQVEFNGFTVGGGYNEQERFGDELTSWNIGIAYELGPWGFAAQYYSDESDGLFFANEAQAIGGGAVYTIAPGLTAGADIVWLEGDAFGSEFESLVVLTELKAAF